MPSSSCRPTALSGGRIRSGMVPALSGALRRLAGRNKRRRPPLDPGCLTGSVNQSGRKKDRPALAPGRAGPWPGPPPFVERGHLHDHHVYFTGPAPTPTPVMYTYLHMYLHEHVHGGGIRSAAVTYAVRSLPCCNDAVRSYTVEVGVARGARSQGGCIRTQPCVTRRKAQGSITMMPPAADRTLYPTLPRPRPWT